jgi:hypothetical protein
MRIKKILFMKTGDESAGQGTTIERDKLTRPASGGSINLRRNHSVHSVQNSGLLESTQINSPMQKSRPKADRSRPKMNQLFLSAPWNLDVPLSPTFLLPNRAEFYILRT